MESAPSINPMGSFAVEEEGGKLGAKRLASLCTQGGKKTREPYPKPNEGIGGKSEDGKRKDAWTVEKHHAQGES